MTAFSDSLEEKVDEGTLTDERGRFIAQDVLRGSQRGIGNQPAHCAIPEDSGPSVGKSSGRWEWEVVMENRITEVLYMRQFVPVGTPPPVLPCSPISEQLLSCRWKPSFWHLESPMVFTAGSCPQAKPTDETPHSALPHPAQSCQ